MKDAITNEALKAAPPVTVSLVAWVQGLTINEVVGIATLGYILLQAAFLIWKWRRERKAGADRV